MLDVWHADEDGHYDIQQPGVTVSTGDTVGKGLSEQDCNYRAKVVTNDKGEYSFQSIRPKWYPIPSDGPVGTLCGLMKQHTYRCEHSGENI